MRERNFARLLKILNHETHDEPVLFEHILNDKMNNYFAGYSLPENTTEIERFIHLTKAFAAAGYDYIVYTPESIAFKHASRSMEKTVSLNEGAEIFDWESFGKFPWPDSGTADYSILKEAELILIEKMKILLRPPGGILRNTILFFGYDNLCYLIYDDPKLVKAVCDAIGERLLEYYRLCISYNSVGAMFYNDDWGFNSGPFFSPDFFKEYIFPWVRKLTGLVHKNGKPAILHSCGNVGTLMDSIIDDLKFDAKHSFEDKIMPIEDIYKIYGDRIAILGGIDVDFLSRASKEDIYERSKKILELGKTNYALGTGNSVPDFVPMENYLAMISAAGLLR